MKPTGEKKVALEAAKKCDKEARLQKKYKISIKNYDDMMNEQKSKCPICDNTLDQKNANVDRNHKTGLVRGILCNVCNPVIREKLSPLNFIKIALYLSDKDKAIPQLSFEDLKSVIEKLQKLKMTSSLEIMKKLKNKEQDKDVGGKGEEREEEEVEKEKKNEKEEEKEEKEQVKKEEEEQE